MCICFPPPPTQHLRKETYKKTLSFYINRAASIWTDMPPTAQNCVFAHLNVSRSIAVDSSLCCPTLPTPSYCQMPLKALALIILFLENYCFPSFILLLTPSHRTARLSLTCSLSAISHDILELDACSLLPNKDVKQPHLSYCN